MSDDYRRSHLEKGATYDAAIAAVLADKGVLVINNHRNPWAPLAFGSEETLTCSYWGMKRLVARVGLRIVETYPIAAWLLRHRFRRLLGTPTGQRWETLCSGL